MFSCSVFFGKRLTSALKRECLMEALPKIVFKPLCYKTSSRWAHIGRLYKNSTHCEYCSAGRAYLNGYQITVFFLESNMVNPSVPMLTCIQCFAFIQHGLNLYRSRARLGYWSERTVAPINHNLFILVPPTNPLLLITKAPCIFSTEGWERPLISQWQKSQYA